MEYYGLDAKTGLWPALSLSLSLSLSNLVQQFVRMAVQVMVFWVPTPSRTRICTNVLEEYAASVPSMIELCSGRHRQMIKEEEVCSELHLVMFKERPFIILVVTLSHFALARYMK